jgi:hypothetical protein
LTCSVSSLPRWIGGKSLGINLGSTASISRASELCV